MIHLSHYPFSGVRTSTLGRAFINLWTGGAKLLSHPGFHGSEIIFIQHYSGVIVLVNTQILFRLILWIY